MVNELGDLQLAGWWVGQSSLRVTAGYERDRMERLNEARERLDRKEVATETATNMSTSSGRRATRAHHYRRFYIAASPTRLHGEVVDTLGGLELFLIKANRSVLI